MKPHPAAEVFRMMNTEEHAALVKSIEKNGQLEPIWTLEGMILDGRNRYRACLEANVVPETRAWMGAGSPAEFVIAMNKDRRHLTPSEKAAAALKVEVLFASEAKERQKASGGDKYRDKRTEGFPQTVVTRLSQPSVEKSAKKSRAKAAEAVGASPSYVSDAKKIKREAPDLFIEVEAGTLTIPKAKRKLKERSREAHREGNRQRIAIIEAEPEAATDVKFSTIVIDPPWDWGDEGDQDQLGRSRPDYATMSFAELEALDVGARAATDAHIYLWITNRSLPKGFRLLEAWGFRYVTCITWAKPHYGMGNYFRGQTEHLLFGVRGSQPLKRKDAGTIFHAQRGDGGHSSKPGELYDLVESCSPGPYLDMFSRRERSGWSTWGEGGYRYSA